MNFFIWCSGKLFSLVNLPLSDGDVLLSARMIYQQVVIIIRGGVHVLSPFAIQVHANVRC